MSTKKIVLIILNIFLVLFTVNAQNVENIPTFNLDVLNTSASLCDHDYVIFPITIKNIADKPDKYIITVEGPDWVKISNNDITLLPNESKQIFLLAAPDYGETGTQNARLIVEPYIGKASGVVDFNIEVRECNSVKVDFIESKAVACSDTENSYGALILNKGEAEKTYVLDIKAPEWVSLDENKIKLKPGEARVVIVKAKPTGNSNFKFFDVELNVYADDESSIIDRDNDKLVLELKDLKDCYKSSLDIMNKSVVVDINSSAKIPITIRNEISHKIGYHITLSGDAVNFVSLSKSEFAIDSNENKTINLNINPYGDIKPGRYNLNVELNLENGQFLFSEDVKIKIVDSNKSNSNIFSRIYSWFGKIFSRNEVNQTEITDNSTKDTADEIKEDNDGRSFMDLIKYYKWHIISAVLFLILIFVFVYFKLGKKIVDFFDEDFEDKPKTKRKKKRKA